MARGAWGAGVTGKILAAQTSTEPLLRLALALAEAPADGLTLGQLLVASGASRASLYRYLDRLRDAGWRIEATHDDDACREVRYRARLRRGRW